MKVCIKLCCVAFLLSMNALIAQSSPSSAPVKKPLSNAVTVAKTLLQENKYDEARKILVPAAEAGDGDAEFLIGQIYEEGWGIKADLNAALEWYKKGSASGSMAAHYQLGAYLLSGKNGVKQDAESGIRMMREAAESGFPAAEYGMGSAFWQGVGVDRNYEEARRWFARAAEHGDPEAELIVGGWLLEGRGMAVNYDLAHHYLHEAANSGNTERLTSAVMLIVRICGRMKAEFGPQLGPQIKTPFPEAAKACHEADTEVKISISTKTTVNGVTVEDKDNSPASSKYYVMAEQGDMKAQKGLAAQNQVIDLPLAVFWLDLAAKQGDRESKKTLARLEKSMDDTDRLALARFQAGWRLRHPVTKDK